MANKINLFLLFLHPHQFNMLEKTLILFTYNLLNTLSTDLDKHLSSQRDLHKIKVELILTDNVVNINVVAWNGERGWNNVPSHRFKTQHDMKPKLR